MGKWQHGRMDMMGHTLHLYLHSCILF